MANRNLVDVLANLVRKGFGKYMIGRSRDLSLVGLTFREAYEAVELRVGEKLAADDGEFGSEAGSRGEVIVFRVNLDGSKPSAWLTERTTAEGEPF